MNDHVEEGGEVGIKFFFTYLGGEHMEHEKKNKDNFERRRSGVIFFKYQYQYWMSIWFFWNILTFRLKKRKELKDSEWEGENLK